MSCRVQACPGASQFHVEFTPYRIQQRTYFCGLRCASKRRAVAAVAAVAARSGHARGTWHLTELSAGHRMLSKTFKTVSVLYIWALSPGHRLSSVMDERVCASGHGLLRVHVHQSMGENPLENIYLLYNKTLQFNVL